MAVTANVAVAVNNVRQNTFVRDCSLNTVTGDVTLVSNLNKNSQMGAKARVGASTATSGSVSYANLTANACVANFNAVHTALVSGISGTIHGTLSVMANTASLADAGVYSGSAVSYYSGTVTVVYAYAGGSSKADLYLEKNKKLRVGKLNLTNQYQTKATAESKQSDNGISVNMAAADLNVAYAEACSVACAGIEGDGSLSAEDGEGDSLIVLCQGTAAADAKILPANVSIAGVKLAANNVFSKVTAQHTAHIGSESTAPDVSSNGNISVISRFNESGDGATATVGSGNSSNVNVSLLGVTESLALAEMEAQAKAAIVNGTIRAKGNVDVQMLGRLIAKAEVYNGSTLGLYNATVMVVRANAKGSMEALLNAKTIEAATVNVKNDYYAQSEAETGFAGGLVAGIGSASSNVAYATTSSTAKAAFGAAAGGNITGSISLENLGHVSAKALGRSATVTVSGLNVAVNVINADLNAVQNTSFTYGGKLDIQGDVNIRSEILREGDFGKADAQTGSTAGASISLVGASANKATAATATRNTLTVRGVGENRMTLTGSFTARAKSVTESFAKAALPQSLGLASIGSMISDSSTRDVVSVTVTGACMEIDGTFKAESIGNTASTSEAHKAGGVGVAEATFTTSDAKVGAASDKPQTVGLTVTGGSIQALEDIILRAYNKGTAQSIVKKGTEVSGIGIAQTRLPTNSWYSTNVSVTDGAVLTAEGSITLTSEDTTEAKADATGTNIGFAINADYTKGENHITSNNTVTIGAKLQADDSLTVTADSKATMTAKTVADGGGFFTKGTLTAINELIRSCLITVAENSDLSANHGSLSICANAGENDVITTTAKITSGGVVALGNVRTELTLKTTSKVHIHDVGHIQNRFGTVTIRANASQNGVVTNSSADCSGLGVAPDVHNQAVINLESNVNIQNVKEIEGRYVYINAVLKKLDVYSYGYAKGSGLGANIDAMNDLKVSLTANTRVEDVTVIGHDGAVINATSEPDYLDANVHTDARVQLNAIGHAYAKSKVITREAATVTVQSLTYKGASIRIDNRKITGDRIRHEEHTGGFIRKHTSDNSDFQSSSSITVKNITLYLGDAAAGVFIDVSEKSGVRQVGIRNEEQIWMEAGSTLTFGNIANYLPGYAYLYGSVTGLTVYDQSMLPALTVTNSTNMDLIFKSMTYVNTYFYEFKDKNGKAYYMDGLGSDAKRVNVEQKVDTHQEALGYSKLLLNGMEVKYGTDTGVACFANKQPKMEINNVKYYQLGMMDEDGNIVYHPYTFQEPILENGQATGEMEDVEYILYVAVSGDQVSIVKEKQRPDIAPEKGDKEGYWQDNGGTRYEKGELATATISVVQTKEDGTQETVSVQGSFEAFGKDQSIPYYRKTTVESNATVYTFYRQTGTDTNGTALYTLCTDAPIKWLLTDNVFLKYEMDDGSGNTTKQPLTQRDGTNERYLLVNEAEFDNWQKDKRLKLHYTDGTECQEYEILCKWEGLKKTYQLVYAEGQQYGIVESGYTQQAQYKEWTETYHVATFTASGRTVRFDRNSRENFIDPTRHSAEQNSQVLVLRFGSAGDTITFTGKIADIGLKTTHLPTNAVATGSNAYKVTESMYLTKSGLIVNIKGNFASKFDGKVYTSTKLIAEELGKLAVSKNLTGVNENGETIYVDSQNHVYVMNHQGRFHCAETDHTMTEAETLGILYEVQPTQNSGPKITVLKGQNITLERLTDHIAHDINNISTTGNWRYDGTFYYSEDGESNWTAIPEKNIQVKDGVITVSYFDSKAQRNVELRIYKGPAQDDLKEITFMEFATYDKDGNPVYVKAGSDGSVVMVGAPATQKISTVESGTDYTVKNIIAGENVEIRVNDPNGSLFNGNDDPQAPCVVAKEKAIIISAGGAGSIGTEDKPLNIQAKEVEFLNQDMEQVIVKDTYVYIDQGDTSLDGNIVVDGVIWKLETADGSVTAADKTLTVKNGGTASILTNKEPTATSSGNVELKTITVTGKDSTLQVQAPGAVKTEALTVTDGGTVDIDAGTIHVTGNETVTGGSTVTKTAEGNITVDGNREVTGSTLTETSTNGSIAVGGDETVTGGSTVTKDAKGDITVGGDQRVTGSTLTETSSNGSIETKGNVTLADSEAHLTAHKDLTVEGNLAVTGGTLKAQAETGSVTLTKLRTWQTTTDFQAGADMRFDDWMSAESKNTVSVGGTFGVRTQGGTSFETYEQGYGNRAFVKYADTDNNTNALFSLSAGSVGTKDNCGWIPPVAIPAPVR